MELIQYILQQWLTFTIGLVTEDVIQTLIKFTQEKLSNNKYNNQSKTNKSDDKNN